MFISKEEFLLRKKIDSILSGFGSGLPVSFEDYLIFSAEFFDSKILELYELDVYKLFEIIITNRKAEYLGFIPKLSKFAKILGTESNLQNLIDNKKNFDKKDISEFNDSEVEVADISIELMKLAKILPIAIFYKVENDNQRNNLIAEFDIKSISKNELELYKKIRLEYVEEVCRAKIALKNAKNSEVIIFRDFPFFGKTHLAIIIGDFNLSKIPIVRIHSGCYTGDLLQSLQCDCYDQLHKTIEKMNELCIEEERFGIIIYQAEDEGRAIGLTNKIRTYNLQRENYNTIDANHAIGYEDDERDFSIAMKILKKLEVNECDLITNNPKKIKFFHDNGILIRNRVSLQIKSNYYNGEYINIKSKQMGHIFET